MEHFKKIGQACRLHYEKVILSLMLLGVAVAVLYLYGASSTEAEIIRTFLVKTENRPMKPLKPADLAGHETITKLAQNPPALAYAGPHNLFNPVKWQKKSDGTLIKIQKGDEVGGGAVVASDIRPLSFIVTLDKVSNPGGYFIGVTREAAEKVVERKKKQSFATLNTKTAAFTLREIKGPPEDPAELVLELVENNERISVFKDKPYARVDAYEADLKYPPENKTFSKQRVGATLNLGGEDYNIVAINQNEVVLSARSEKKYTVRREAGR